MNILSSYHSELVDEQARVVYDLEFNQELVEEHRVVNDLESNQDDDDSTHDICAICQEEIKIGELHKRPLRCEHCFHAPCIDQWLSTRAACPVCRMEVFIDENASSVSDAYRGEMDRFSSCSEIIIDSDSSNSDPGAIYTVDVC